MFLKSLHLIAVFCWIAALLYLPRLFVYHADSAIGSDKSETFKLMEKRLANYIMTPAMLASYLFGILLAIAVVDFSGDIWFHAKFGLVLLLSGLHGFFCKCYKNFAVDNNKYSSSFFRIINEVPTVLIVLIIFIAVFKHL